MDLLSGLIGAVVGGLIASLTTLWVFHLERKRQNQSSAAALTRELTVSLVRSLEMFRDCQAAPNANDYRIRDVLSTLEADAVLFRANLDTESPVAAYVDLVKQYLEAGYYDWIDSRAFATYLAEPLLRWSVSDAGWSDAAIGLLLDQMKRNINSSDSDDRPIPSSIPSLDERRKARRG